MPMNDFHFGSNVSTSFTVDSWILIRFRFVNNDILTSLNIILRYFIPFEVDNILYANCYKLFYQVI